MKSFRLFIEGSFITIYRGESVHNRGGNYWTTNKEWARQFTQSGQDKEIKTAKINPSKILKMNPLPKATSEAEFDAAIAEAKRLVYPAVWFDEGPGEPNSVYVIYPRVLEQEG